MLAIARALAMEPRGLLCDEITSALDSDTTRVLFAILEQLKRDRLTLLLVTRDIALARRVADHVVILAEGRVLEQGPPCVVIDQPRTEKARLVLRNIIGPMTPRGSSHCQVDVTRTPVSIR
jgi:polar amino acid transport system ATP-binding protein